MYHEKFVGWTQTPKDDELNWKEIDKSMQEIAGFGKLELKGGAVTDYALPLKSWRQMYAVYLKSDNWRWLRDRKLKETHGKCERCGASADVVHHLHYNNLAEKNGKLIDNSELCDLQSLCHACHNFVGGYGPDPRKQNPKYDWTKDAQRLEEKMGGK